MTHAARAASLALAHATHRTFDPVRILRRWTVWAASLAVATLFTALSSAQSYASRRVEGLPARWERILPQEAINWYTWALVAPLVIALASQLPWSPARRRPLVAAWVALPLVFCAAHSLLEVIVARNAGTVPTSMPFFTMFQARFTGTLAANLIVFSVLVLAYYAAEHYRDSQQRQQRAVTLEAQLAESRLEVLRQQLQPHFLFNALHAVSSLMEHDVAGARRVLTRLGDLLRLALDRGERQEASLAEELEFLDGYLDIQRVRFADRLSVRTDASREARNALVPSLLLQPIVENAIRHAVEPRSAPGSIAIRAWREDARLMIEVHDDGAGLAPGWESRQGIGLANTRARLQQLYGTNQSFTIGDDPAGGVRVSIVIPYRAASSGASR